MGNGHYFGQRETITLARLNGNVEIQNTYSMSWLIIEIVSSIFLFFYFWLFIDDKSKRNPMKFNKNRN